MHGFISASHASFVKFNYIINFCTVENTAPHITCVSFTAVKLIMSVVLYVLRFLTTST